MKRNHEGHSESNHHHKRHKDNVAGSKAKPPYQSTSSQALKVNTSPDFAQDIWQPGWNFFQPQTLSPSGFVWSLDNEEIHPEAFFALESSFVKMFSDYPETNRNNHQSEKDEKFSKDIWGFFIRNQQPGHVFRQKIELWCELNRVLGPALSCRSHAFGSTLNGFGGYESDLDLCLFFDSSSASQREKQRGDIETLGRARTTLRRQCSSFLSPKMELIPAKVPVLKVKDNFGKLEVDLSCNNPLSINNTHLLFVFSQLDWRVRPLVITIKSWAKTADINEAKDQTLSSYVLSLMVLHYLQAGVKPPVIPALQQRHPDLFGCLPITQLSFFKNIPTFQSTNTMTLGELFVGFFSYYYNDFDFARDVGSVRTGKVLTVNECHEYAKNQQLGPRQWEAYICMEEPFERTNAGRAIINRTRFDEILRAFRCAEENLRKGNRNLKKFFSCCAE